MDFSIAWQFSESFGQTTATLNNLTESKCSFWMTPQQHSIRQPRWITTYYTTSGQFQEMAEFKIRFQGYWSTFFNIKAKIQPIRETEVEVVIPEKKYQIWLAKAFPSNTA